MPIFTQLSKEELEKLLSTKNNAKIAQTPEEKLNNLLYNKAKRGIRTKKFHFNAIENGTKLVLFDGDKKKQGEFAKNQKGVKDARTCARKLFLIAPAIYRNGGFKFDCTMIDEFGALKDEKEIQ